MQELLGKLRSTVAIMGFADACLYAASRAMQRLGGSRVRLIRYRFVVQPVSAHAAAAANDTGRFTLAEIGADSPLFAQIERPPQIIARRFAQSAHCLAATIDADRLAGFLWYVIGPYDEDEVRARFEPVPEGEAAWDFDVSILPRYRMGRLFSYLWTRATRDLAARGVRYSVSRISAFNPASIASHRRLGARTVATATFVCFGRWQLMWSSLTPRLHLSWREGHRPQLRIGV